MKALPRLPGSVYRCNEIANHLFAAKLRRFPMFSPDSIYMASKNSNEPFIYFVIIAVVLEQPMKHLHYPMIDKYCAWNNSGKTTYTSGGFEIAGGMPAQIGL